MFKTPNTKTSDGVIHKDNTNLSISTHEEKNCKKSAAEKAFLRKLNYTLLPGVFVILFIQYVDKTLLSTAAVLGILQDTHMTGSQFSWLGSVFYLGYLSYQVPNNYFIRRLPVGRYLGVLLTLWGISVGFTAACQNFAQLAVLRVILGLFEAGTYPCVLMILSTMYRRSEQSACNGFLFLSNCASVIVGSFISYGIGYMNGIDGIAPWKWAFIIWGIATVVCGIAIFFFLIDDPYARLLRLTNEEKLIVDERTRDNAVVRNKVIKYDQMWEAVKEVRLWCMGIVTMCIHFQNGGLILFSTQLKHNIGFSRLDSILLQIPSGVSAALFLVLGIVIDRKTNQLILAAIVTTAISLIGLILAVTLPNGPILLLAYLLCSAITSTYSLGLTVVSNNVSGYTKKVFYYSVNMVFYTVGNFVGPQMMIAKQAPRYLGGMVGYAAANVVIIICLLIVRQSMARVNKRRQANPPPELTDVHLDLTDRQDDNFIYRL